MLDKKDSNMPTKRIRGILGEDEPFLTGSKASKLRVFDAILNTGTTLYGSFAYRIWRV
jgi:hypothetical protein